MARIGVPPSGLRVAAAERQLIDITLRLTGGNQARAARILGIARPTVTRKLNDFG